MALGDVPAYRLILARRGRLSIGPCLIPQYRALWREQKAIRLAAPAVTEIGIPMPDPRHMDATQAFAGFPAVILHLTRRLRLDSAAATADLFRHLAFTAPVLPNQLGDTEFARPLSGLQRCREATPSENAKF